MREEDILKYITGNCLPEEAENIRNRISSDPEFKALYVRLKNIFAISGSNISNAELTAEFLKFRQKSGIIKRVLQRTVWEALKYAAVVLVTLTVAWFLFGSKKTLHLDGTSVVFNEITVPKGQISEYLFSDGTRVWLNSGSTMKVPEGRNPKIREAWLKGEAYFEVSKNEGRPFVVHTETVDIKVLGTSFNIMAYSGSKMTEATLVEGKVEIIARNNIKLADLKPGEMLRYSAIEKSGKIFEVDTTPYQAWKDGKLMFMDKPLGEIAFKLERWYNVKITFNDEKIKNYRFTGTILKNKPFDQVLQVLKLTAPIRYEIKVLPETSNEVTLYSTKR